VVTIAGDEAHRLAYAELAQLVYSGVLLLDAKDFAGWLGLCADDFSYAIRAWSP
jgi:3-phenylpropionate/cinnamic acid dioxygenase small subunit